MKALPGSIRTEKGGLESTSERGPKTGAETDGRRHAGVGACALPHTFLPFKNTALDPFFREEREKEIQWVCSQHLPLAFAISEQDEKKGSLLSHCPK